MKRKHINKSCLSASASGHQFCFVAKKPCALKALHQPLQPLCGHSPGGGRGGSALTPVLVHLFGAQPFSLAEGSGSRAEAPEADLLGSHNGSVWLCGFVKIMLLLFV